MTDQTSTTWNFADVVTTTDNSPAASSSTDFHFYFRCANLIIAVVGAAGNALVLYALVASQQHRKHLLIVNQNVLDFFSSFVLIIIHAIKLCNIYLTGTTGYWICVTVLSGVLGAWGQVGSIINLAIITTDRYLKVVHPVWSKKRLRPVVIYSAMAFAWFVGIITTTPVVFETSRVIRGRCYSFVFFKSKVARMATNIYYSISFYFAIIIIFIFCYGRILVAIRRQASVMAGHSANGSSTANAQSNRTESNVIKTMILVSALYVVAWLPTNVYNLLLSLDLLDPLMNSRFYAITAVSFLYISANPFIYATKFNPVRQILRKMILCQKPAIQPTDVPLETVRNHASDCRRSGQDRNREALD